MVNVIKLRKGLDINLKGKAKDVKTELRPSEEYALVPDDFVGITPKVVVREGDVIKAGDVLFVSKNEPVIRFASPVSGTVSAVVRCQARSQAPHRCACARARTAPPRLPPR